VTIEAAGPSLTMNSFEVSDGSQDELLGGLERLLACIQERPGFLEGALLESVDRTRVVTLVRMRSEADRIAAMEDRRVRAALRSLEQLGRSEIKRYELVRTFEPAEQPAGVDGR
jgi:heme-degrading monooxygenase HmoA